MARTLSRLKNKRTRLLGQEVYQALKESIISGELKPRQRLIEENLAAEMGASRTPVREAIQKLESENLVTKLDKGGFIVRPVTTQDIEEMFGILSVLESYAAYLTTLNMTDRILRRMEETVKKFDEVVREKTHEAEKLYKLNVAYHDIIYKASGSKMLYEIIYHLRDYFQRYRRAILVMPDMASISSREHLAVLEAMRDRDADTAELLVKKHILRAGSVLLEAIKSGKVEL